MSYDWRLIYTRSDKISLAQLCSYNNFTRDETEPYIYRLGDFSGNTINKTDWVRIKVADNTANKWNTANNNWTFSVDNEDVTSLPANTAYWIKVTVPIALTSTNAGQDIIIANGQKYTVDVNVTYSHTMTIEAGGILDIDGDVQLTIAENGTINNQGTIENGAGINNSGAINSVEGGIIGNVNISGNGVVKYGTFDNDGNFTPTPSDGGATGGSGSTVTQLTSDNAGQDIIIANDQTYEVTGNVTYSGTMTIQSGGTLTINDNVVFINIGTITNNGTINSSATSTIENNSTIVSIQTQSEIQGTINNYGIFRIVLSNKDTTINPRETYVVNNDLIYDKTLTIEEGGTLTINDGVTLTNQGTITNNSNTIYNYGTINNSEGTITNNNTIYSTQTEIGGTINNGDNGNIVSINKIENNIEEDTTINNNETHVIVNSIELTATLTINAGATLIVNNNLDIKGVDNSSGTGKIINNGTIYINCSEFKNSNIIENNGTIYNYSSGFLNGSSYSTSDTNATLTNEGTIENSGIYNAAIINSGTIDNSTTDTNTGEITNTGVIKNDGTIINKGIITNEDEHYVENENENGIISNIINGEIINSGTITNNGQIINNENTTYKTVATINTVVDGITGDGTISGDGELIYGRFDNGNFIQIFTVIVNNGKFVIDGDEQPTISLTSGQTYDFDVSAVSTSHPFRFKKGDTQFDDDTDFVTYANPQGTSGAVTTFTVPADATDSDNWTYYCANHSGMGGSITIQDPSSP